MFYLLGNNITITVTVSNRKIKLIDPQNSVVNFIVIADYRLIGIVIFAACNLIDTFQFDYKGTIKMRENDHVICKYVTLDFCLLFYDRFKAC